MGSDPLKRSQNVSGVHEMINEDWNFFLNKVMLGQIL